MKQLLKGVAVCAIATMCAVTLAAQAPADRAAIEKALAENELKVNLAFEKVDVAGMKAYLAPEATMIGDTGYTTVADFFKQMPTMQIKVSEQKLTDFKFTWVDATTVIASYTWAGKGTVMGQAAKSPTYASTVWTKRGDKWLAMYHQETPAAAMPGMAMPMKK
ncbi:MAG: nuclear transport factor 2 family protein [Acidobacteriota bacterium]